MVKYLCSLPLELDIDAGASDNYAIRVASNNGHWQVFEHVCSLPGRKFRPNRGVNPGAKDNHVIRRASCDHLQIVEDLCSFPADRGVNPGANDNNAIKIASFHGHLST